MKAKTALKKAVRAGIIALVLMTLFYAGIMFISMPQFEVWFTFVESWYLISGIILGFGFQIGLWIYLKNSGGHGHGTLPATSGAMSGTAMAACCAHHLAEILPILGISGAAVFLSQYQKPFLILGLSINLLGIAYMLHLLGKQKKIAVIIPERG